MRSRAAAAAGLALALGASIAMHAMGAQAAGPPTAAASADCVPVQHSKKVVKRVKVRKNGRVVTVKRKKTIRWETCEQRPSAPTAAAPSGGLPPCAVPSSNLLVTARDRNPATPRYSPSRLCVTAGSVRVQLENQGEDPHHVFMRPVGSGSDQPAYRIPSEPPPFYELEPWNQVGPIPTAEADVTLTAGDWYLWCDLLTHEDTMNFTLQVR